MAATRLLRDPRATCHPDQRAAAHQALRPRYEAGPTGYGLARALAVAVAGVECVVAAPGKIERAANDRVKTDRRDSERLVRLLMVDGLCAVRIRSSEKEALRGGLVVVTEPDHTLRALVRGA